MESTLARSLWSVSLASVNVLRACRRSVWVFRALIDPTARHIYRWARAFRATGLLSPLRVRQSAAWARWLDGARLASAAARAAAAAPQPPRRFYPAGSRLR